MSARKGTTAWYKEKTAELYDIRQEVSKSMDFAVKKQEGSVVGKYSFDNRAEFELWKLQKSLEWNPGLYFLSIFDKLSVITIP